VYAKAGDMPAGGMLAGGMPARAGVMPAGGMPCFYECEFFKHFRLQGELLEPKRTQKSDISRDITLYIAISNNK
jgi:hypothetical protein